METEAEAVIGDLIKRDSNVQGYANTKIGKLNRAMADQEELIKKLQEDIEILKKRIIELEG